MKKIAPYFVLCLFAATSFACNPKENQENKKSSKVTSDKIEVYYFHFTRRCITCNAVENVSKEALEEYFSDEMKKGKITFQSVNLDEESGKEIADKLEVSGQALLFVAGNKQVNLTNDGFMYAKGQPDKLKAKVKETVDNLKMKSI